MAPDRVTIDDVMAPDEKTPRAQHKVNPLRTDRLNVVSPSADEAHPAQPQLRRTRDGRLLAGVCAGVAEHLGVRVLWVRMTFAILSALGGAGILAYALLWVFVPQGGGSRPATRQEWQQGFGIVLLGVGALVAFGAVLSMPAWLTK